ncbi:ethanolamine ammonia-lyase subunit EutC [Duganella sp. FT94W]|uniref:Ethanolamine ammonia-lyase small subunit n=1 Tax=Duganella lactea TaxID=2692173 RepID=A0ABW9V7K4_9BURK|nr:ethanolamine ammonia-lyase subunit EutC [Duganella lactea]MYM33617.1 ethanolamine ammonia-lyase subunit EutC [Duganella lactea]
MKTDLVVENPWRALRRHTDARIGLGRAGVSLPTAAQLAFQLDHARARDAVHAPLDVAALRPALAALDLPGPLLELHSAASSRSVYLQRPDLGRRLDAASRAQLQALPRDPAGVDLALVLADGLSSLALAQNAAPLLHALRARLALEHWTLAPLSVVRQGRVAVGDEVGELLGARMVVVLIGERPGLSSPDSMGLYLSWAPRLGLSDAGRNCISNVRPQGLDYEAAAFKLHYLLSEARRRQVSGVALKDETAQLRSSLEASPRNFLLE